tara:strand:- start:8095 stop:8379 length:285 start_codon:yes stop_codon:yes gene_type:complete
MVQKLLKFTVIILGALIIISFIAIIYGSYLKLNTTNNNEYTKISLDLKDNQSIKEFKIIDKKNILITIYDKDKNTIYGIIYNIVSNNISKIIEN